MSVSYRTKLKYIHEKKSEYVSEWVSERTRLAISNQFYDIPRSYDAMPATTADHKGTWLRLWDEYELRSAWAGP